MKRMLFSILLAIGLPVLMFGQAPVLARFANGLPMGTAALEVTDAKRITLQVQDGMPLDSGYVYEFGAIYAYRNVNGLRQLVRKFRDSEVMNGRNLNLSFGPQYHPDLMGDIELEIEWIKRYNPNNSVETLPFSATDRTLHFNVHL
jgi:hypothetical protein